MLKELSYNYSMKRIRTTKTEQEQVMYVVGETVTIHRACGDGRGAAHHWAEYGVVVKVNRVTVDIRLNTDGVIRLDKRGEIGYNIVKGKQHPIVNQYTTNCG